MRYQVHHVTRYSYQTPVVHAHHLAHMRPRSLPNQQVERCEIVTNPPCAAAQHYLDYFGNHVDAFELFGTHETLEVSATSTVNVAPNPLAESQALLDTSWNTVIDRLDRDPTLLDVQELRLASPIIRPFSAVREYAARTFTPNRPLMAAVIELNERIFRDFKYDPTATDESTPLALVMEDRRGVCQDFAHLAVGCLRSLGLPARYVSGYMETAPPAGRERLIGADASHAWASVYVPDLGWFDFDPTNNVLPSDRYVTVGWGRDFSDVSPLKGVLLGGPSQQVAVGVDVERIA
jgi:transglutaminase-like putative cysteine protease